MRKDILVFIIISALSGTVYGAKWVAEAWGDSRWVTIAMWDDHNNSIWHEMRRQEIRDTRRKVNELEFIRDEERDLTDREKLRLRDYQQDLNELKQDLR